MSRIDPSAARVARPWPWAVRVMALAYGRAGFQGREAYPGNVTNFLERDDNYEPAVLPSPAELLHWGDLHSSPAAAAPPSPLDESAEFTRFVPRRRKGRVTVAVILTVVLVGLATWGIGSLNLASGVAGIAAYFKGGAILALVGGVLWGVWKWARRYRPGDPRFG